MFPICRIDDFQNVLVWHVSNCFLYYRMASLDTDTCLGDLISARIREKNRNKDHEFNNSFLGIVFCFGFTKVSGRSYLIFVHRLFVICIFNWSKLKMKKWLAGKSVFIVIASSFNIIPSFILASNGWFHFSLCLKLIINRITNTTLVMPSIGLFHPQILETPDRLLYLREWILDRIFSYWNQQL
jgi:hypothetical protein